MHRNIGIIIFARSNSRRLPSKIFKKIGKLSLLEIVIKRAKKIKLNNKIVVASSKNKKDAEIYKICKKEKVKFYIGPLDNVLKRAQDCCSIYKFSHFIRINADRPFLDFSFINSLLKKKNLLRYDLVTNNSYNKSPKGLTTEIIKTKKFLKIKPTNKNEKEHICNHIYKNKKKFNILEVDSNSYKKLSKYNFSLDTKKDLERTKKIYKFINYDYLSNLNRITRNTKILKKLWN